jgi:hypothetical protein
LEVSALFKLVFARASTFHNLILFSVMETAT